MRYKMAAGLGAGFIAGLVFASVMHVLPMWAANGHPITMTAFAAQLLREDGAWAGWLAYVVYAAVLGGVFGVSLPGRRESVLRTAILGGVWGFGWFVILGLGLVPLLLGSHPFSAPALREFGSIAVPLLVGHIVYGVALGAVFRLLLDAFSRRGRSGRAQPSMRRAA